MSLVSSIIFRRSGDRSRCRAGRLGIDIGSKALRVVQLDRQGQRWKVRNRFTVPVTEPVTNLCADLKSGLLERYLGRLQALPFSRTKHCNCVLPPSVTEVRTVEVPPGSPADVEMMSREALQDSLESDLSDRTLRCWTHTVAPRDMVQVSGISVQTELAETVVDQFQACGWKCHQINSLPHALTRAWEVSGGAADIPVGMLSLRHSSALLTVCYRNQPEFMRSLRGCAGQSVVEAVSGGFGLAEADGVRLLETYGIAGSETDRARRLVSDRIQQFMDPYLHQLNDQLQKTLMYLRHHMPKLFPK